MLGFFERKPAAGRTVRMGTDVAAFALYEPEALAHRARESFVWWLDPCAWVREASEGRFVAWTVGSDGGYVIRLVVPGGRPVLSRAEEKAQVAVADFRLRVRHGRVRLDNLDSLPARDQTPRDDPDAWIELAPGPYRIRVQALDATREGGSLPEDAPGHVVAFEPVSEAEFAAIPVGGGPPDLSPWPGSRPTTDAADMLEADRAGFASRLVTRVPPSDATVGLLIPADAVVLPGEHRSVRVPFAFGDAFMDLDWDARTAHPGAIPLGREAGAPVSLVEVNGSSLNPVDEVATVSCRGLSLCALAAPLADGAEAAIGTVRLAPLAAAAEVEAALAADVADPVAVAAFAAALRRALLDGDIARFGAVPDSPLNDWARLERETSADILSRYALRVLRLPEAERLRLYLAPPSRRLAPLGAILNSFP